MFGAMIFIPVYLQVVDGMSPTESGLALLPMVVGLFSTSITAGQIMSRTGRYKVFPILGSSIVLVALLMLSRLTADSPYWYAAISIYVMGAGLGLTMQVLVTVVQNAVDRRDMGVATSSVTFFRQMGGSFGTALFGAILSSRLSVHLAEAIKNAPASVAAKAGSMGDVANNVQAIKALPEPLHSLVTGAFASSLHDTFLSAVPLVAVALVVSLFLKEKPLRERDTTCDGDPGVGGSRRRRASRRRDRRRPVAPGAAGRPSFPPARCTHHGVGRGDEGYGDQGAGDACHQDAGRDRDDHGERVHADQPAEQERLQHVRLELLDADHHTEHDQRDDRALVDQRHQHGDGAGQERTDHRDERADEDQHADRDHERHLQDGGAEHDAERVGEGDQHGGPHERGQRRPGDPSRGVGALA